MQDSALMNRAGIYRLLLPADGDINQYLAVDTIHFINYSSGNVRYLSGKYLVTAEQPVTWQQLRSGAIKNKMIRVLAVNIINRK